MRFITRNTDYALRALIFMSMMLREDKKKNSDRRRNSG